MKCDFESRGTPTGHNWQVKFNGNSPESQLTTLSPHRVESNEVSLRSGFLVSEGHQKRRLLPDIRISGDPDDEKQ